MKLFSFAENLERRVKYYTLLLSSSLLLVVSFISLILRTASGEPITDNYIIFLAIAILSIVLFLLVVRQQLRLPIIIITAFFMITIPLRAIGLSGLLTPALMIYLLLTVMTYVLFTNRLIAHMVLMINAIVVSGLIYYSWKVSEPFSTIFNGVALLLLMLATAMVVNFVLKTKEQLFEQLKQQELLANENLILQRLSNEFNNSLTIATHYAAKLNQFDEPGLHEISKSMQQELAEMRANLDRMTELHQTNKLASKLKGTSTALKITDD